MVFDYRIRGVLWHTFEFENVSSCGTGHFCKKRESIFLLMSVSKTKKFWNF